jgi:hypothetical protein
MKGSAALQHPLARQKGLVVQEIPGETLVYDMNSNRAHCLNRSAALVWRECDGRTSVDEIVGRLEADGFTAELVWFALDQLSDRDLLENRTARHFTNRSRREVIKKLGLATVMAAPVIASIVAPQHALAGLSACACINPGNCLTQIGCPSTVNCNGSGICAP